MTFARPPRRRYRWLARIALGFGLALVLLWCGGLVWFSQQIPHRVEDPDTVTDAIVVLTGGAGRLTTGLDLLARRQAEKLFISGVYQGVDVAEILRLSRQAPEELECCIELGYSATDTAGNARETARWMTIEGFTSLRLVTASYHMPRSLVEFRRAMPDVALTAHPVFTDNVHIDSWWRWPGTANLIAVEFTKYLMTTLGPTRWSLE